MRIEATAGQQAAILGAMREVAAAGGGARLGDGDCASIAAVHRYIFRRPDALDLAGLPSPRPAGLAARLDDPALAEYALRFLAVMAFIDGTLDKAKIAVVLRYAAALGIDEPYVTEMAQAARDEVQAALADMTYRNLESLTGEPRRDDDAMAWFLPYRGDKADPALAARYRALEALPAGSFGRAYWELYRANDYAFPGEENALNEAFATPHDSTHVIAGYDTTPHGEILVSTFTAAMHRRRPMSGHILPVIFSWHLGIKINDVAGSASGALDPERFWEAWGRGEAISEDLFAPGWDFWGCVEESVAALRRRYDVPPLAREIGATQGLAAGATAQRPT